MPDFEYATTLMENAINRLCRRGLRHHRDCRDTDELLEAIVHNQFIIFERLDHMATDTDTKLDALTNLVSEVGEAITHEIKQLEDAQGGMTADQIAKVDGVIARLTTMRDALKADDAPAAPVAINPVVLAAAIQDAVGRGATDVQLAGIRALGDGVSPEITPDILRPAVTAALASASDGSEAATSDQLAALMLLVNP